MYLDAEADRWIGEEISVQKNVPRERMHSPQPTINYSVNIPAWSSFIQRRRPSARQAARIVGWRS